jgi:raffinose/stachyose/melibiose transport system substrate-binding protein
VGIACAGVVGAIALAGCSPGEDSSSDGSNTDTAAKTTRVDPATLGDVTLTIWDKNTLEGPNAAIEEINAKFQAQYPNIKIKRVAREFKDLKTTLKLALSSSDPPDVVQVNQGYGDLGAFAKAGYLRPVDDYAEVYGWVDGYQPALLAQNRSTRDGTWGEGDLYGISSTAELVGVYYNRELLQQLQLEPPTTWEEFKAALAKAKDAGMLPIQYGAADKSPAIHEFGSVLTLVAGTEAVNDLVFSRDGASWEDPAVVEALQTLADWSAQGYIPESANGQESPQMAAKFSNGEGVFMISGTWWGGDLKSDPKFGFTALSRESGGKPEAMGGFGLLWAITSKSANSDAAAAYIDFLNSPESANIIASSGDLPSNPEATFSPEEGSLEEGLSTSIQGVLGGGGLVPYLDYTTPSFYDAISAQVQQVTAGRTSPEDAAAAFQQDVDAFKATR